MSLEVTMLKAGIGDCILIRCGDKFKKVNILIDTGENIEVAREACARVKENNEIINMAILTHDDNDHIKGGLNFAKSISEDKIPISCLEHLTEEQLVFNYGKRAKEQLLGVEQVKELVELCEKAIDFSKLDFVLADAKENKVKYPNVIQLRWDIEDIKGDTYLINEIVRGINEEDLLIEKEHLELIILSPTTENLKAYVKEAWQEKKNQDVLLGNKSGKKKSDMEWNKPIQYWMKNQLKMGNDSSKANKASIAFLLRYKDMSALFAGDASPKVMVQSAKKYLEKTEQQNAECLPLDFIKMPHHGSSHNVTEEFLHFFHTNTYLISTKGVLQYKHPGKKILAEIAKAHAGEDVTVFGNYAWWKNNPGFNRVEIQSGIWDWQKDVCILEEDNRKIQLKFIELQREKVHIKKNIWLGR